MSYTFGIATTGNGIAAIGAGFVASYLSTNYGYTAPFALALIVLVTTGCVVYAMWEENFGDKSMDWNKIFLNAFTAIKAGIVCFLFLIY